MRNDRCISVAAAKLDRLQRLGDRANLVQLDEDRITYTLFNAAFAKASHS